MRCLFLLTAVCVVLELAIAEKPNYATVCEKEKCSLPDCFCGGLEAPGNLGRNNTPQFVLMTFDDAVTSTVFPAYEDIFDGSRLNPNGCPIKGTFFVSAHYTEFDKLQKLYADGHEIASHSITHSVSHYETEEEWAQDIAGGAVVMSKLGNVNPEDIRGMRSPDLVLGGDPMFSWMKKYGFIYDSSVITSYMGWPYTLDYAMPHRCEHPVCPRMSHPGIWEFPMLKMYAEGGPGKSLGCSMLDACAFPQSSKGVLKALLENFDRYYQYKVPFPLYNHASWFLKGRLNVHRRAFYEFLNRLLAMPDVYFVTPQELIRWMRDPVPVEALKTSYHISCDFPERKPCKTEDCRTIIVNEAEDDDYTRVESFIKVCEGTCPNEFPTPGVLRVGEIKERMNLKSFV